MKHPPWLRFQAYVIGLPKTGSTSLATIFGNYRTGHEAGMVDLSQPGMQWRAGQIDEPTFWELTTPRLTRPALEMDSATCHHLYAELLARRFPQARFVHSVRDVGGWVTSVLDMTLRVRTAHSMVPIEQDLMAVDYVDEMTGRVFTPDWRPRDQDYAAVPAMMRYWAEHMRRMAQVMPADRGVVVRTPEIGAHLPELAALCGVPVASLRADLSHSNRAAQTLDRLALYRDRPDIRAAYDQHCADIMARVFPEQHARAFEQPSSPPDWSAHCDAVANWVAVSIEEYIQTSGRPITGWNPPHGGVASKSRAQ